MTAAEQPTARELHGAVRRALLLRQAENSRARDGGRRLMREDLADEARLRVVMERLAAEAAQDEQDGLGGLVA